MLDIVADCTSIALRRAVEKRFRLRRKIRKALAETMGNEDYGTIQIDSQWLEIEHQKVICRITISVHHFSQAIEINIQSPTSRGHSKPVTRLIKGCNNGTLATYLETFLIPHSKMDENDKIKFVVHVCDAAHVSNEFSKMKSMNHIDLRHLKMLGNLQQMPYNFSTTTIINNNNNNNNNNSHNNNKKNSRPPLSKDSSISVSVSLHSSGSTKSVPRMTSNTSASGRAVVSRPIINNTNNNNSNTNVLGTNARMTQLNGYNGHSYGASTSIEVIVVVLPLICWCEQNSNQIETM